MPCHLPSEPVSDPEVVHPPPESQEDPSTCYRRGQGQRIHYGITDSPIGRMLLAATKKGVCSIRFGKNREMERDLRAEFPNAALERNEGTVAHHCNALLNYLCGRSRELRLPLDVRATEFQKRVWAALRMIPKGKRLTYGELATTIGHPGAARAVARACAANPVAVAIPCHRVVRADGALGGFRWGIERKAMLLERERTSF